MARTGNHLDTGSQANIAFKKARVWARGFSKIHPDSSVGYLPDVGIRDFLFPTARIQAVRGYETASPDVTVPAGASTILPPWQQAEGVDEDELSSLGDEAPASTADGTEHDDSEQGVEPRYSPERGSNDPMEVPGRSGEEDDAHSVVTTLSTKHRVTNLEHQNKEIKANLKELLGYARKGSWAPQPSPHEAPAVDIMEFPDLRVVADAPEKHNPWAIASRLARSVDGVFYDTDVSVALIRLEFAAPFTSFAGCRYRFRCQNLRTLAQVPEESMILTQEQAKGYLADVCQSLDGVALGAQILARNLPAWKIPTDATQPSFLAKFYRAWEEKWVDVAAHDGKFSLKELQAFGGVLPEPADELTRPLLGFTEIMTKGKFLPSSARTSFFAETSYLPQTLCDQEYEARKLLMHCISAFTIMEGQIRKAEGGAMVPRILCRELGPLLVHHLEAWAKLKLQLRRHALQFADVGLVHVKELLYASPMCKDIFPSELVSRLIGIAKERGLRFETYLGFDKCKDFRGTKRKRRFRNRKGKSGAAGHAQGQGQSKGTYKVPQPPRVGPAGGSAPPPSQGASSSAASYSQPFPALPPQAFQFQQYVAGRGRKGKGGPSKGKRGGRGGQ